VTFILRPAGPGGPGRLLARGSHRSVRAHTRAYGSSNQGFATSAIRRCFVNTSLEFRSIRSVSQRRVLHPTPRFPPPGPCGWCSPASTVLSRRYDFLPPVPPHFVAFVWRYHGVHLVGSISARPDANDADLELVTRCSGRDIPWRRQDLPSSWGTRCAVCTCSSTPAGPRCLTTNNTTARPSI